jgi:hypothetical protein
MRERDLSDEDALDRERWKFCEETFKEIETSQRGRWRLALQQYILSRVLSVRGNNKRGFSGFN